MLSYINKRTYKTVIKMIPSSLKHNLLLSLFILNIGLILSFVLLENSDLMQSKFYLLKIITTGGLIIGGLIYLIYILTKILSDKKTTVNSESSNPLNS